MYKVYSLAVATRISHNYQALLDDGNRIIISQWNFKIYYPDHSTTTDDHFSSCLDIFQLSMALYFSLSNGTLLERIVPHISILLSTECVLLFNLCMTDLFLFLVNVLGDSNYPSAYCCFAKDV